MDSKSHEELGADYAEQLMKRLHYPNDRIDRVVSLIRNHMYADFDTPKGARRFLRKLNGDVKEAFDLMLLRQADKMGRGNDEVNLDHIDLQRKLIQDIVDEGQATTVKSLAINGNDLKEIGIPQGPEIGTTLNKLLDIIIENPELNNQTDLINLAEQIWKEDTLG